MGRAEVVGEVPAVADADLGRSVGRGAAWSALNSTVLRMGQFLMGIVIARMVAPEVFGVFVVATTVYTIIINFSDFGVSAALVRDVTEADRLAPTVSSLALGTNALLAALMAATAGTLAGALGAPGAANAIRILAVTLLLAGVAAVPGALLTGTFRQRERLFADVAFFVSSNAFLVVMLAGGGGVLSLAMSRVIGQAASTLLLLWLAPTRYLPGFDRGVARRLLRFGVPLSGASLVGFLIGNTDFMVVGRLRGASSLGFYNLAYNISGWPVSVFTSIAVNVALPAFTRVRHTPALLAAYFSAVLRSLGATALPTSALILALSNPLVETVYGERWLPAAPALAMLAAFGAGRVVLALLSDMLVALGETPLFLKLQVLWLVLLVPLLVVGVHRYGIVGAGAAHLVAAVPLMTPVFVLALRRHLPWLTQRVLLGALLPPLAASTLAGLVAALVARQISWPWLALLAGGAAGALVYLAVLSRWLLSTWRALTLLYHAGAGQAPSAGEGTPEGGPPPADEDPAGPQGPGRAMIEEA